MKRKKQMTLKELADLKGWSVADIASMAGVSLPTAYKGLFGRPMSYSSAKAIAEATGGVVSVTGLCEGRDE